MTRILVIADDLSGAAEIASVGVRCGLRAKLVCDVPTEIEPGLTVIDTDTRHRAAGDVADVLRRGAAHLRSAKLDLIYKKTDSVMRGPVLAEIEALMQIFRRSAALLVAQNPSRGRTIRDGIYRIDNVPLASTAFVHDPEYPAQTSSAVELLGKSSTKPIRYATPDEGASGNAVTIGEASTIEHVRQWAMRVDAHVLPAGGADFFRMLLETRGHPASQPPLSALIHGNALFVCGSASAHRDELIARAQREHVPVCPMLSPSAWEQTVVAALDDAGRALMVIDGPLDRSPGAAQRLQSQLADVVARVLNARRVENLLLEGGATASAVCRAMGWSEFDVEGKLAPGVAQLRVKRDGKQRLIVKPGSYVWPEGVFRPNRLPPSP